ncbi:MAG TPA: hypothetical protein DEH78_03145 [Solibacterales bacterium]|nr:hypothetical protein [Bryobacterales bacterium]
MAKRSAVTIKDIRKLIDRYRVTRGKRFRLQDIDPADTHALGSEDKPRSRELLAEGVKLLAEQQDKLYAQDRRSLLLVFQAMDAAGKDGTIKHVMSGVNPQGVQVHAFKAPSAEELDHDWMWRTWRALPERGRIGIFNRSWYEEVLVVRVHPAILQSQKLPPGCVTKKIFKERLRDIAQFEDFLTRNGTRVLKFFLHVSKQEQKRRFLDRIDREEKNWKFSAADARERQHWGKYMQAYEECLSATSTKFAPWYVIPADDKPFMRLATAAAVVKAMQEMDLEYPKATEEHRAQLQEARKMLTGEGEK